MKKRIFRALVLAALLLSTQADAAQVSLSWNDNSANEQGFRIQRKLFSEPDSAYVEIGTTGANVPTFVDKTVTADVIYCYRVNAFNTAGTSPFSAPACLLATPTGLVITYTP